MILGFQLDKVSAEKKAVLKGGMQINARNKIRDVKKIRVPGGEAAEVRFEFAARYVQGGRVAGSLLVQGRMAYSANADAIVKGWKKDKAIPGRDGAVIVNNIIAKALTTALVLSERVGLPPPIKLPAPVAKPSKARGKALSEEDLGYIG